jgi:hypothetical protein
MTRSAVQLARKEIIPDFRPLALSRIATGLLLILRTTPILHDVHSQLFDSWPLLGWPEHAWNATSHVLELPDSIVKALCILRTVAAVFFTCGVWTLASGVCAGVCGYLVLLQDPFGFIFTLHLLYQAAILLAITDSGAAWALRRAPVRAPHTSYRLIRAFVASIYFWAGLYKLRPDWLDGRTLSLFYSEGVLRGWLADHVLATAVLCRVVATGVALIELSLGPLLLWERSRRHALWIAFAFHAGLEITAHPDLLGWAMAALLPCFLPSAQDELTRPLREPPLSF